MLSSNRRKRTGRQEDNHHPTATAADETSAYRQTNDGSNGPTTAHDAPTPRPPSHDGSTNDAARATDDDATSAAHDDATGTAADDATSATDDDAAGTTDDAASAAHDDAAGTTSDDATSGIRGSSSVQQVCRVEPELHFDEWLQQRRLQWRLEPERS